MIAANPNNERPGDWAQPIVMKGWTKEEAIKEMIDGGYGFHEVWANIIPWINKLDVGRIKKKAGM
jgi:hypothetical protein